MTQLILYNSDDGDSVVKEFFTTAADGNLSEILTGSQNPT